jgi:hypothetical protein
MIRNRALLLSFCGLAGMAAFLLLARHPGPHRIELGNRCYDLAVGEWSAEPFSPPHLPGVVLLDASRDHPWRDVLPDTTLHVVRGWNPDGSRSTTFDLWRRTGPASVAVFPFLRPAGFRMTLEVDSPTLRGSIESFTDWVPAEPQPNPRALVTATEVACPPDSARGET